MENFVSLLSTIFWSCLGLCVVVVACFCQMIADEKKRYLKKKYSYEHRDFIGHIESLEI